MERINDSLIFANRNYVPIDFIVVYIDCNPSCPIIFGRLFLRTISAVIDMKEGNIKFQFTLRRVMEHFPRTIIKPPYESIMRASYGSRTKGDKTQILALRLSKGVKLQRLLGGNPMNKIYFCFLLSVLECQHNYSTVIIVFLYFNQCLCRAKPLGSCWVIVDLILLKKQ